MKRLLSLLFLLPLFAYAQTIHTVAPKETLYSLSRLYNFHPKELADYNNIPVETGLTIGQLIKIPATGRLSSPAKNTMAEKTATVTTEKITPTGLPVYHKVEKNETLYHISKLYPNTTADDIKKWNNMSGDGVTEGMNLIVGYQKEKKNAVISTVVVKDKEPVADEPKKPVVKDKPIAEDKPVINEPVKVIPVKTTNEARQEPVIVNGKIFNGGYFKSLYNEQSQKKSMVEETGTAAVFKSTSGWDDGKYYCLHNTAPAGSIIKITCKNTQKSVYAKVLDVIPDLKQNVGIMIRLSNAAANELGAGEMNFESIVNY